jgi:hypothetical protein
MYLNVWNPANIYKDDGTGPRSMELKNNVLKLQHSMVLLMLQNAINQTFEKEIGRTATKEEIDAYTMGVNAAAKKEPSIYDGFTTTTGPTKGASLGTTNK